MLNQRAKWNKEMTEALSKLCMLVPEKFKNFKDIKGVHKFEGSKLEKV
jgi:1,2-phenylacetyl-CoA epoxidase catalytic subunit